MMGKFLIFDQVKKEGRSILTEFESKKILKQAGDIRCGNQIGKDPKRSRFIKPENWFSCCV